MCATNEIEDIEQLRSRLASLFRVRTFPVYVGTTVLTITSAADIDELIDRISEEEFRLDERLPYWATVWHSAVALGSFLQENPHLVADCPVLELGCGLGVAGIIAARCGARVTFSDHDPHALLAARINAGVNAADRGSSFLEIDIRDSLPGRWPVILAADIVYEKRFIAPLADFFANTLEESGLAILAEPDRSIAEPFFPLLESRGYFSTRFSRTASLDGRSAGVSIHVIGRSEQALQLVTRGIER